MKKIIGFGILLVLLQNSSNAQDDKVELKELKVPVSPAFSILDLSPKTIESPGTVKAFTTSLVSNAALAGGLPKSFAFEFAPYWFFKHPNMNIYKYYGLHTSVANSDSALGSTTTFKLKQNIFYGLRSTSISLASVFKDSSKALPVDVNYISYAIRSNIINIKSHKIARGLKASIDSVNGALQKVHINAIAKCNELPESERITCIGNSIAQAAQSTDSLLKSTREQFLNYLNARPAFSVDLALASSMGFGDNKYSNRKTFRTGGWITLAYYQPLISKAKIDEDIRNLFECKNYFNAFFLFRMLSENKTLDYKSFTKENLIDFGGRAEFEFNRFSISVESIRRINQDTKSLNTTRTVGIFQYKVNDNLFLLGTFGKDFGTIENIVSLFGINWGFGENALNKPFN